MVATVRLLTASNGTKSVCFTLVKSTRDPAAERTATSIASSLLFLRRQRRVPQHVVGTERTEGDLLLDRQLVHGQRSGLVAAQHIDAGELLNRREARHNCPLQ